MQAPDSDLLTYADIMEWDQQIRDIIATRSIYAIWNRGNIRTFYKQYATRIASINEAIKVLRETYAEKDEAGNIRTIDPGNGQHVIVFKPGDAKQKYQEEMGKLLNTPVAPGLLIAQA